MNKKEAIQDAKKRMETTGLVWMVIKIKLGIFKRDYDTVSEHHEITHKDLYRTGHFKKVYVCKPEAETELNLETVY
jgi:hypothetical protein